MSENKQDVTRARKTSEPREGELPPGVKLLRKLRGHKRWIGRIAWSPDGRMIASPSGDKTIRLWNAETGTWARILRGHSDNVNSVAWSPDGQLLATAAGDKTVKLWESKSGRLILTFKGHTRPVEEAVWSPDGKKLASVGTDNRICLWEVKSGDVIHTITGFKYPVKSIVWSRDGQLLSAGTMKDILAWNAQSGKELLKVKAHNNWVLDLAWQPESNLLASCSSDSTIKFWDIQTGQNIHILEGHTAYITSLCFSNDGRILVSKGADNSIRIWSCDTWETVAQFDELAKDFPFPLPGIDFNPKSPILATLGAKERIIRIWELDLDILLGKTPEARSEAVHHTTAKIVLVGDSGVGKTGLGWRLAHGEFKEHASTHGQQFWVLNELGTRRADNTECEAILWDLAGQPDYRLTQALFLDDADLALVLFDPTDNRDPLHGVEFWLKQLKAGRNKLNDAKGGCPTILVGARADRGEARLTQEELDEFCRQRGIAGGYLATSAKDEIGLEELLRRMKVQIPWDQKTSTVTTVTFKRIKDYALELKENSSRKEVIVNQQELRKRLEKTDKQWEFTDAEMMTAIGHLANYGYVRVLRTSKGEERILLAPELLNNLAASFVLEARRNPKGLGSLEEKRLLAGEYQFRELEKLSEEEQQVLLDSAALLFIEHNICFRETDPLSSKSYLVFPELINLKKPLLEDEQPMEDGVAYTVSGAIENVYASLVVLLGYTQTFTRTDQWRSQARYEVGDGLICGFRQEGEREGEMDLVLYFGTNVGQPVRTLFQGLFESFLARRNLNVFRFEPVICSKGHALNRAVVREQLRHGITFAHCSQCGERLNLPKADEPIQLTQKERQKVDEQQWFAAQRTLFEQAVFQVASYVEDQKLTRPECFISYAWGDKSQERWVERSLATDLQKAGINVVLDRWENARVGASVSRFVERIEKCDRIIVVGTPAYRKKYENKDTSAGYVVAAEVDMISNRLLGTEDQKETVLPVLLVGEKSASFPPLLHGRVYADFRNERAYFTTAFDLILNLYAIPHVSPAVADLRESLAAPDMRNLYV
jgi:WD40 repeat protein